MVVEAAERSFFSAITASTSFLMGQLLRTIQSLTSLPQGNLSDPQLAIGWEALASHFYLLFQEEVGGSLVVVWPTPCLLDLFPLWPVKALTMA